MQAEEQKKTVTILLPVFNEAAGVENAINRIERACQSISGIEFDYVAVDDGSTDETLKRLLTIQQSLRPKLFRVVELTRNFGKEAALTAGLSCISSDACIILDADLQDPPEVIPQMICAWRDGFDVVALRRNDRSTDSFFKRLASHNFYRIFNLFSEIKIPKNVGDSRLIDRRVIDALKRLPENTRFMKGLFAWVGFNSFFIDVKREERLYGKSKFNPLKLTLLAINGITSFSTSPLRLWMYLGLMVSTYAFFHGLYIIGRVLTVGVELPGYASLTVILLFISGIQLIGIGIIGEYIGRVYIESKRRPSHLVKTVYE